MTDHLILPVKSPFDGASVRHQTQHTEELQAASNTMSGPAVWGVTDALVPLARRCGLAAAARAYDAGMSAPVLAI